VRLRRTGTVVVALAVVTGGGYAAWAQASEPSASYRTATVTRGDVEQLLEVTGTLEAAGTDELAFATSGTVATVDVSTGQKVRAGQLLGTLDRTSLRTTAKRARAELAAARAALEEDEETQADQVEEDTDTSTAASEPATDPTFEPSTEAGPGPSEEPDPLAGLGAQQDAVTSAQTAATQALALARDALAHQQDVCTQAFADEPTSTPSDQPSGTPTTDPTTDPDDQACTDALVAVQDAQQQVAVAQDALQTAIATLTETLSQAAAALQSETTQEEPSAATDQQPTEQPSDQQPTEQPTEQPTQPTVTVTAATLARDQAEIEQAKADVVAADQALAGAVLRASHAGRVVQVSDEQGSSAAAGTTAFTVVSKGLTSLTATVTDTQLHGLEQGQPATVTPVGAARGYGARVTYVDPVPDTSTDTTTYAVTLTLDEEGLSLPNGAPAVASVVIGTATDVLTVPTSAVASGSVEVLSDGKVTRTRVTTGIVGTTRVEVSDGLKAGDEVVIADLAAELPSADDSQQGFRGGTGGLGGFSGNGPPVGAPPGRP
jgi:multidrug efflux pump subunit AcrA (membrane-fusion protein)